MMGNFPYLKKKKKLKKRKKKKKVKRKRKSFMEAENEKYF